MSTTIGKIEQMVRWKELCSKLNLSKNTIRKLIAENKFPRSIHLSKRAIGWKVSEVNMYLDGKWEYKEERDEANDK